MDSNLVIAATDVLPIIAGVAALLTAFGGLYVGRKTGKSQDRKSALEELVAITQGWKALKEEAEARAERTEELLQRAVVKEVELRELVNILTSQATGLKTEVERLHAEINRLRDGGTDGT